MSMNAALNNGVEVPALGFGVFQTPPGVTAASVAEAPRAGAAFGRRGIGTGIDLRCRGAAAKRQVVPGKASGGCTVQRADASTQGGWLDG
jgi:hypothetical protein